MPRERRNRRELYQTWIDSDPDLFADISMQGYAPDLFCNVCEHVINSSSKTKVTRHLNSHASYSREDALFSYELTEAFLASRIPLYKLNSLALRNFLEKYMDRKIPHSSTLRRSYVDQVYDSVVESIREDIADNFVYFIIDEFTDACGRLVVNFIIGALKSDSASESHLLASKVVDKTDHRTIVNFVNDCLNCLWPKENASDKVLVMLSDTTTYMLNAGKILSERYRKMIHFTGAAYTLNRVAEKIWESFPLVNILFSNVKKVFNKAPSRRDAFTKALPGIPLPPQPVLTRWGTWLQAIAYYDENFCDLKSLVYSFDANDGSGIRKVQALLKDQSIHEDISYINRNYGFLVNAIQNLEMHGLSLNDQFSVLDRVRNNINNIDDVRPFSIAIKEKLHSLLKQNPGYNILEKIRIVLAGSCRELPSNVLIYSSCVRNFSYCPLSSIEVERLVSLHRFLLSDRRRGFTPDNIEKHLVICFKYR